MRATVAGFLLLARVALVARPYLAEAISSVQDGKRFRIDYSIGF